MKKFLLALSVIFVFAIGAKANYALNESNLDQAFAGATEVQIVNLISSPEAMNLAGMNTYLLSSDKNAFVAAILAWFLGGFAIHRYYLGTKGSMFFYYFCTFGGIFGIVPFVDFIVLLINSNDISKYVNNEKFIMW
ncbi:MAG: TM2 domain-containing protein [Bacteroidales bacterium]|nr:TM2 domain-containing protein [Bacteroidales bacterium]